MNIKSNSKSQKSKNVKIKKECNTESCTNIIYRFLYAGGVWIDKNKRVLRFCQFLAMSSFIITNIAQAVALVRARHDKDELFGCASVLTFCCMGLLKNISLTRNKKKWETIFQRMANLETELLDQRYYNTELEYESDNDTHHDNYFSTYISQYTKKFKLISVLLSKVYISTGIIYVLAPFIELIISTLSNKQFNGYPHILPIWAPFENIFAYFVIILCELLAAAYCVAVHISFDLVSVGIMIFVCGQFNLIKEYSQRIGGNGKNCTLSETRNARALYRIKRCHYMHMLAIGIIKELNELTKSILGVYFIVATLTLCSVAVQLKTVVLSVTQMLSLFQYMFATLIQLFLYCFFGNSVYHESYIGMGEGPNAAAYWCLSPRVRQQIVMLNVGLMKSRRLRAGPFNTLDMPSFIQIVRTAYSYYTVWGGKSE